MTEERQNNLWEQIEDRCLKTVLSVLEKEAVPTTATVRTVRGLVETAIAIDALNLQRAQQSRYGAAVFRGQPFSPPKVKN